MEQILKKIKGLKNLFIIKIIFGTNLRLTEIQSLAGLEQLKNLKMIQKKKKILQKVIMI